MPRPRPLLGAWAAATCLAGLTVVAADDRPPTADDVLDQVVADVVEARSATFDGTSALTDHQRGDDPAVGPSTTTRMRIEGAMVLPDRLRAVLEGDFFAMETLQVGADVFNRSAEDANDLDEEQWAALDDDVGGIIDFRTEEGSVFDPSSVPLLTFLRAAHDPVVARTAGRTEVRFALDTEELLTDAAGREFDEARGLLVLAGDGLPARFSLRAAASESLVTLELRYDDWGSAPEIAAPAEDDIDPTPGIDEAALASSANDPTPPDVYQLAAVPTGWELLSGGVDQETDSYSGCEEVWLEYGSDDVDDYLYLTMMRTSCARDQGYEPGVEDFGVDGSLGYVELDGTGIILDGSMNDAELERLIDVLEPFDRRSLMRPDRLPAADDA